MLPRLALPTTPALSVAQCHPFIRPASRLRSEPAQRVVLQVGAIVAAARVAFVGSVVAAAVATAAEFVVKNEAATAAAVVAPIAIVIAVTAALAAAAVVIES